MVEDTKPGGQTDVALLWAHDQNIGAASPGVQPGDVLLSIGRCFDYSVCLVVRHNTAGRLRIVGQTLLGMAFDPCSGGAQCCCDLPENSRHEIMDQGVTLHLDTAAYLILIAKIVPGSSASNVRLRVASERTVNACSVRSLRPEKNEQAFK